MDGLIGIIIFFQPTLFSLEINIGGLFILLSAMTWAVGILLLKRFGIDGSLSTVIWMAGLAALLQAPLTFIIVPSQYLHLNMEAIFYALLSFLLSSIIANILWLKALSYTRNESLSQLILFMPVVVLIGDIFYVGATLHWYELIGGILIIGAGLSKFASLNKSKV